GGLGPPQALGRGRPGWAGPLVGPAARTIPRARGNAVVPATAGSRTRRPDPTSAPPTRTIRAGRAEALVRGRTGARARPGRPPARTGGSAARRVPRPPAGPEGCPVG